MNDSAADVAALGTILSIWAHPDDECFCAGGLMAAAVKNGQRVVVVTASRGDSGKTADENRWPQKDLGAIREKELDEALRILGIKEHYWLDYPDGSLDAQDADEASAKLVSIMQSVRPQTILSFGPDGLTGHPDHQTMYAWTKDAMSRSDSEAVFYSSIELTELHESPACQRCHEKFNIYLGTDEPRTIRKEEADLLFELPQDLQSVKQQSIGAHQSQMSGMMADPDGKAYIKAICCCEAFVRETA